MITLHDSPDSASRYAQQTLSHESAQHKGDGERSWQKTRGTMESLIGDHPLAAFGLAMFAGIALGWWIKRR
jgi:hypothetical protein